MINKNLLTLFKKSLGILGTKRVMPKFLVRCV